MLWRLSLYTSICNSYSIAHELGWNFQWPHTQRRQRKNFVPLVKGDAPDLEQLLDPRKVLDIMSLHKNGLVSVVIRKALLFLQQSQLLSLRCLALVILGCLNKEVKIFRKVFILPEKNINLIGQLSYEMELLQPGLDKVSFGISSNDIKLRSLIG